MNQYQKTTEKKKQAIIQAALQLFKEKGFKETSIKSIAEVAEVSPVSIYNYFGGKDNLVALCVNDGSIISVVGKTTVEIIELFECRQKVP